MGITLSNYGPGYLLLNNSETWPIKCREFLNKKRKVIEEYIKNEEIISEAKKDKENFDYTTTNRCYDQFSMIRDEFEGLLLEEKCSILCYHATRLFPFEVENIKSKGLSIMNETFLRSKINNLYRHEIINFTELNILSKTNFLNNDVQRVARENKLYFIYGNQDIRYTEDNTSYIYPFYNNYGGEVIFNGLSLENPELLEKLNSSSKPYIIICSVLLNDIKDSLNSYMKSIIINFHRRTLFNIKNEFSVGNDLCKVLDVIEVNEKSKFVYD